MTTCKNCGKSTDMPFHTCKPDLMAELHKHGMSEADTCYLRSRILLKKSYLDIQTNAILATLKMCEEIAGNISSSSWLWTESMTRHKITEAIKYKRLQLEDKK